MDHLEHGRECYERRAWGEAYQALQRADEAKPLQAEDLERLATAACLSGREAQRRGEPSQQMRRRVSPALAERCPCDAA